MNNLILIGMPGVGKSCIGVVLAKALGMSFIDSDIVIQEETGRTLSDIIADVGREGFLRLEEEINVRIECENSVIATGGSVIYGPEAMEHLRAIGRVVYLQLSYPTIEARLGDLHARGVSIAPGQTLLDLYNERCPLYEKYAHITVACNQLRPREVAAEILSRVGREAPGLYR